MSDLGLVKMPLFCEVERFSCAALYATRSADDLADYGFSILRRYRIIIDYFFQLLDIFDQLEDVPVPEPSHRSEKPQKRRSRSVAGVGRCGNSLSQAPSEERENDLPSARKGAQSVRL